MENSTFACTEIKDIRAVKNLIFEIRFSDDLYNHQIHPYFLIKTCKKVKKTYRCEFNIHQSWDENIILGEPFFRNYLVTFDLDGYKIGLIKNQMNELYINSDAYMNSLIENGNRFF